MMRINRGIQRLVFFALATGTITLILTVIIPFVLLPQHQTDIPNQQVRSPSSTQVPVSFPPSFLQAQLPSALPSAWPSAFLSALTSALPSSSPSVLSSIIPTSSPTRVTYLPGDLNVKENGLTLSSGLKSKVIARTGRKVQYKRGTASSIKFHANPDGAAVFAHPTGYGWVYVSNSEVKKGGGGVGAIQFDANGDVIDYKMILTNTSTNCSGGRTPWNTWVSCEENKKDGQIWETDPFGAKVPRKTVLGGGGGNYEAMATDNRDPMNPQFFVTNDREDGEVRRFTPSAAVVHDAINGTADYWSILSTPSILEYLVLNPSEDSTGINTFSWTTDLKTGKKSASKYFPYCEGIDFLDGTLYFVSKTLKEIFILDLDGGTYRKDRTKTKKMTGQPDAINFLGDNGLLYLTEEDYDPGVYGRDLNGNMFTILEGRRHGREPSGLAFSPDNLHMYVAFLTGGILFDITREDGLPFDGKTLNIRHHAT